MPGAPSSVLPPSSDARSLCYLGFQAYPSRQMNHERKKQNSAGLITFSHNFILVLSVRIIWLHFVHCLITLSLILCLKFLDDDLCGPLLLECSFFSRDPSTSLFGRQEQDNYPITS